MRIIYSGQVVGLTPHIVSVEVDLFRGFHTFSIVGLPDKAVEESKDRVSSAIKSAGFDSPKSKGQQKVIVSLAPADLKKEGPIFDLAIALGYLLAKEEIRFNPEKKLFLGELSLGGELRGVRGALPLVEKAKREGFKEVYLPKENADEASYIDDIFIFGVSNLAQIISHLNTKKLDEKIETKLKKEKPLSPFPKRVFEPSVEHNSDIIHFEDIRGQEGAKRGLEIAAAGGHNIAFFGPPGTGKTLLAKSLISILPPLSLEHALEVIGIYSTVGREGGELVSAPPFRSPHHTSSYVSIVGGGTFPKPGEITLSHRGVLFLDEFPEFDRRVVESLREPLEEGIISVARAKGAEIFPAQFILVAAFNPCPCGYWGDKKKECICTPSQLVKYNRKISGPIIDRIDMWISVPRIEHEKLSRSARDDDGVDRRESERARARIEKARELQARRFRNEKQLNAHVGVKEINSHIPLNDSVKELLVQSAKKLDLSARSYHRVIKLSRTIADLDSSEAIKEIHLLEALQYRPKQFVY